MNTQLEQYINRVSREMESPLIRWSALFIVIFLFIFAVVEPYFMWRGQVKEQIEQQTLQLSRQQRVVDSLPKLERVLAQSKEQTESLQKHLLQQTTDSSAQAALMSELNKVIRKHGLKITGRRFEVGDIAPNLGSEVSIRLTLTGNTPTLYQFLNDVSQADLLMVIEPLNIRVLQRHTELQVTVSGYRQLPDNELKRLSQEGV
ncbi:type II secretion system protein GspM [Photobacterium rosenbergii]|uniref:type II secretion system protein GspM n=1 Tax=Photobacterium rosenbergii TaxID=294936 RepID=UPI001C9933EB|nr:type II secretion system protein GspM [Photobacterium rosenbergii]MBY5947380.1 type II secretion system protein M [Photobacterium rosenbergii]